MNNKIVVIGWDGATFDIINPLIKAGKMPNLQKIITNGFKRELYSSIPPISAPAWISFMTGRNPGKHGVLGFQTYNLSKYSCFNHGIVTSNSYEKNTVFDVAGKYNKRSIAFQVPLTYPVWPVNGIMVAGYPTPDQTKSFTFPSEIAEKIGNLYEYKSDQIAAGSLEEKIQIYSKSLERVSNSVEKLLKEEPFDLFVYVNNTIDCVQHKFWKYQFNDTDSNDYIDYFYIKMDEKLGRIMDIIDDDTTLIVLSDHGAGKRPEKFLNINFLLREQGFLTPRKNRVSILTKTNKYWFEWIKEFFPMRYWSKANFSSAFREKVINTRVYKDNINWNATKAYRVPLAYPFTGININLKDRQENGIVSPGNEFDSIKDSIYQYLSEFSSKNKHYIRTVYKQEDIYSGPNTHNTPDIIVELAHEYDSGSEIDELITEIPPILLNTISGYHRPAGILAASGKNIISDNSKTNVNIMDLAPTILYLMGLPVDQDIDGRIITEMIEPSYLAISPQIDSHKEEYLNYKEDKLSEEDESKIMSALCEMGYM